MGLKIAGVITFVLLALMVAGIASVVSDSKPPKEAIIRVTENNGTIHYAKTFNFDEPHQCIVFTSVPKEVKTEVCGNYKMEAL